jgi:hypothetical protein
MVEKLLPDGDYFYVFSIAASKARCCSFDEVQLFV